MTEAEPEALTQYDLSALVIPLLKGVIYQENDSSLWNGVLNLKARVRDYVAVLGVVHNAEGRDAKLPNLGSEQNRAERAARGG